MEDTFQIQANGQSILKDDLDLLGTSSGLADDRVFAELLRLLPYNGSTPSRGILPYASSNAATVAPNGATGQVLISPFRAVVGPRTAVGTDAKANWRDIRSAIAVGTGTLTQTASFGANASGNPRWDLVYAAVSIDVNAPGVTRLVKDPTSKVIASETVVNAIRTTVAIGVQAGTAAASPVWPAVPSDAGGVYYVPLAYVRIPNGFSASSIVLSTDIAMVAPVLRLSRAIGAPNIGPSDMQSVISTAQQQSWGSTGTRPKVWMPPDMTGGETLLIAIDVSDASSANWSHQDGDVVDSRDWRDRLCKASMSLNSLGVFAWKAGSFPLADSSGLTTTIGQTMQDTLSGHRAPLIGGNSSSNTEIASGAALSIYCGLENSGKLSISITGVPRCLALFWLEFSGPYTNK